MAVSSRHPGGPLGAVYDNAMAEAKGIARLVQKQAGRAKEKVGDGCIVLTFKYFVIG